MKERALISLCALGAPCRYHGRTRSRGRDIYRPKLIARLAEKYELVPLCPEQLGGLPTPRPACRRTQKMNRLELAIVGADGKDYTEQYIRGAQAVLDICQKLNIKRVYLQRRSPSCDPHYGITACLLRAAGIRITSL